MFDFAFASLPSGIVLGKVPGTAFWPWQIQFHSVQTSERNFLNLYSMVPGWSVYQPVISKLTVLRMMPAGCWTGTWPQSTLGRSWKGKSSTSNIQRCEATQQIGVKLLHDVAIKKWHAKPSTTRLWTWTLISFMQIIMIHQAELNTPWKVLIKTSSKINVMLHVETSQPRSLKMRFCLRRFNGKS